MAGYSGYSMSNNAVEAYYNGEKPLSKWTKAAILSELEEMDLDLKFSITYLKKFPVKFLKDICLCESSWHHTSSYFNKTNFYSVAVGRLEDISNAEELDELFLQYKNDEIKQEQLQPEQEIWECEFLEWSGTRKHPNATKIVEVGVVKGEWFYRKNGTKKKTSANGFRFIKRMED